MHLGCGVLWRTYNIRYWKLYHTITFLTLHLTLKLSGLKVGFCIAKVRMEAWGCRLSNAGNVERQGPFLREMPLQLLGVIQIFMSCGPRALEGCALAARVKSHTRNPGRKWKLAGISEFVWFRCRLQIERQSQGSKTGFVVHLWSLI